jgi:multidrug efflux pump subunit AcrA (membrane-fusion protein)
VTLDAFGDSRPFAGTVTTVDLAETLVDKVVYYEVTVTFADDVAEVKLGMSADVYITTATRQDVLVVPQRAVRSDGDRRYVLVELSPGQTEERTVSLGLRGDDGLVEVLTGLSEGDAVVVLERKDGAAT